MTETHANRMAVVTGGGSGIGAATSTLLARSGAAVAILDFDLAAAQAHAVAIESEGGRALAIAVDVRDPASVAAAMAQAFAWGGRLDCAVNCAGVPAPYALTADVETDAWNRVIDVNLNGVFHCLKHEIPYMLRAGHGAIVNVSSILGLRGMSGRAAYVAAKHAIVGLTRAAALDYCEKGIRINAVAPGYVETPLLRDRDAAQKQQIADLHPMKRLAAPDEIARVILALLSDSFSFVTGETVAVDGGYCAK